MSLAKEREKNAANKVRRLNLYNPKNGTLIANDIPLAGAQDVDTAVTAAEAAFPTWRATPATTRRDTLLKFAALWDAHTPALAELTRLTLGAPIATFNAWETAQSAETFRYYAGWIDKFGGDAFPQEGDGFLKIVRHEPLGVTVGIVPWNGPLGSVGLKAAPALATGNVSCPVPSKDVSAIAGSRLAFVKARFMPCKCRKQKEAFLARRLCHPAALIRVTPAIPDTC